MPSAVVIPVYTLLRLGEWRDGKPVETVLGTYPNERDATGKRNKILRALKRSGKCMPNGVYLHVRREVNTHIV